MRETRNIVLGVTGSIAAYKAAEITSQLTKQNCLVHVVMTADALEFITPLPFKTLSRNPVITDLYDEEEGWKPAHVKLADEADLLLIAAATANNIAKLAHGFADDLLRRISSCSKIRKRADDCSAMNGKMWLHPATQQMFPLKARGRNLGPDEACSLAVTSLGRL
jgi:phosphopantothenoylcysteine synthetase/decarboxylase